MQALSTMPPPTKRRPLPSRRRSCGRIAYINNVANVAGGTAQADEGRHETILVSPGASGSFGRFVWVTETPFSSDTCDFLVPRTSQRRHSHRPRAPHRWHWEGREGRQNNPG